MSKGAIQDCGRVGLELWGCVRSPHCWGQEQVTSGRTRSRGSEPNGAAGAVSNEVERDVNHTLKLYPHKNEKLLVVQITAFMRRIYGLLMWYKYIQYTNTSGNKFHWTTLLF